MYQLTRLIYRNTKYPLLIPFEGRVDVAVRKGDLIKPGQKLFKRSGKRKVHSHYIPKELSTSLETCSDYVVRLNGEYVVKGEVLAERVAGGGLVMKKVYATNDGILSFERLDKGYIDILSENEEDEMEADFFGKVIDIDVLHGMSIETMAWYMPTLTDNFHEKSEEYKNIKTGIFEVIGDGSSVYVKKDLAESYRGKIVFAGRFATSDFLNEIYQRGAEYVFTYSMDYSEFTETKISVGIIGGFGQIAYPKEYLDIWKSMKGSFSSIDLERNMIVWPDRGQYLNKSPIEYPSNFVRELKIGMNVIIQDVENYGVIGKVADINKEDHMVFVELTDGSKLIASPTALKPIYI